MLLMQKTREWRIATVLAKCEPIYSTISAMNDSLFFQESIAVGSSSRSALVSIAVRIAENKSFFAVVTMDTRADREVSHVEGDGRDGVEGGREHRLQNAGVDQQRIDEGEVDVQLISQLQLLSLNHHLLVFVPLRQVDDAVGSHGHDQSQFLGLAAEEAEEENKDPAVAEKEQFAGALEHVLGHNRTADRPAEFLHPFRREDAE